MEARVVQFPALGKTSPNRFTQVFETGNWHGIVEVENSYGSAQDIGVATISKLTALLEKTTTEMVPKATLIHIISPEVRSLIIFHKTESRITFLQLGTGGIYVRRGNVCATLRESSGFIRGVGKENNIYVVVNRSAKLLLETDIVTFLAPTLQPEEIARALSLRFNEIDASQGEGALILSLEPVPQKPIRQTESEKDTDISGISNTQVTPRVLKIHQGHSRLTSVKSFIRHVYRDKKKRTLAIGVIACLFFFLSVGLGVWRQASDKKYTAVREALSAATKYFDEAIVLMDSNSAQSRKLFLDAQAVVESVDLRKLPNSKEKNRLEELKTKISDNYNIVSKIFSRSPEQFYDAGFLKRGRLVSTMSLSGDTLYFLDSEAGMVAALSLATKNADIIGGGDEFIGSEHITGSNETAYVYQMQGIYAFAPGQTEPKKIITIDTDEAVTDVVRYGTNLYVFVRNMNAVFRYTGNDGGFDERENYFGATFTPDLSRTSNIAIDGSVWFGSTIGKVYRYSGGAEDPIVLHDVDPPLGDSLLLYTDEESELLYILDNDNKRVVAVTKEGQYTAQYVWTDDTKVSQFVVSEKLKKAILLIEGKLYAIDIS